MNKNSILLLDSNIIMYLLNGDKRIFDLLNDAATALSFVSEIELLGWPNITEKEKNTIETFIASSYYYDYSQTIKTKAIELRIKYKLKLGDAFIVATAIEYDLTLISADKQFSKVKELQYLNYSPTVIK